MSSRSGRSIELFFVDGEPDGMVTATIPFQWTGHVLVSSRTQIKQALSRPEAERPGVYMLVGEVEGKPRVYVGETDEIKARITTHVGKKDWWSTAILISSSGDPINKAHARYLESRLIADVTRLRKINLDNDQLPPGRTLSEAARAHMDVFLDNIYLVLPALRFDFLTEQATVDTLSATEPTSDGPVYFTLSVPRHGVQARARLDGRRFIVEAGSIARKQWSGSTTAQSGYAKLYNELVDQGILVAKGDHRVFSQSYAFQSSSAAAAVTAGRPTSGPGSWQLEGTTKNYGDWERENLENLDVEIKL